MKILKSSLMCLSIMLVLSACTSTNEAKKNKQKEIEKIKKIKANLAKIADKEKQEAKKFAQSQADNYYKALKNKDYNAFCKSKKNEQEEI